MVSLYERGGRAPSWETFARLVAASGAAVGVTVEPLPSAGVTLAELAARLAGTASDGRRQRLVLDFLVRFQDADPDRRHALVITRPEPTGDERWDALLGALAEHLTFHDATEPPGWCTDDERFLVHPWFWVDLPSVRRSALLSAPTAFRRRNVWIDRRDLERV